jgi:TP901 family phage tail tape measure protein
MGQAAAATDDLDRKLGKTLKGNEEQLKTLGQASLVAGGALALGLGKAVGVSASFQRQLSGVAAVSNSSAEEMARLSEAAMKAGASTKLAGVSASDAARAEAELVKAGVSVSDVLGGALMGSLSLASAGQLDFGKAAEISAQAMNIFGLSGRDVGRVADVLAAAANKSAADVEQLGDALRQGGLVASQVGLSMEETVATLALFADNALVGSDAGTSLKTMLQRLTPQSEEAAQKMEQLGFSAFDASGEFIGMEGLTGELRDSFKDLTTEQRSAAFATIFGADAVRAASVLFSAGESTMREYNLSVLDQGAAARMAAKQMDNLSGDIEGLGGVIETALIKSGSEANGVLRTLVQTATDTVSGFSEMPASFQAATMGVGALSSAGLIAFGTYGTLIGRFRETQKALMGMGTAGRFVGGHIKGIAGVAGIAMVGLALMSREMGVAQAKTDELLASLTEDIDMSNLGGMREALRRVTDEANSADERWKNLGGPVGYFEDTVRGMKMFLDTIPGVNTGYFETKAAVEGVTEAQQKMLEVFGRTSGNLFGISRYLGMTREEADRLAKKAGVDLTGAFEDVLPAMQAAKTEAETLGTANRGAAEGVDELTESQKLMSEATQGMLNPLAAFGEALTSKKAGAQAFADEQVKTTERSRESWEDFVTRTTSSMAEHDALLNDKKAAEAFKAAQADATDKSQEKWRAFVDNVELSLSEYAASLEEQNTNVRNWHGNLATVAGRAGQDVALALFQMGEDGVHLTAKMATGTDQEVQRMARALRDQSAIGGSDLIRELDTAMKIAEGVSRGGAKSTVDAMAEQLNIGVGTVRDIAKKYGIVLNEGVEPVRVALGGRWTPSKSMLLGKADGGFVDFYGLGGFKESHQAQIARAGDWRVWAEPETGGEAYIPLARNKRARSLDIWQETGRRLGMDPEGLAMLGNVPSFARGGFHRVSDIPRPPASPHGPPISTASTESWQDWYDNVREVVEAYEAQQAAMTSASGLAGSTTGLNPQFLQRFLAYSARVGGLRIVSGFRSRAQQERLYALYLSGRGNLAARPGSSKHERGLAIDHAPRSTPGMRATAREFRLHYPVRGEPWHVEPFAKGGILNPFMQGFDQGGWLQPGWNLSLNGTGRPEYVPPPGDTGRSGPSITIKSEHNWYVDGELGASSRRQLERMMDDRDQELSMMVKQRIG